VSPRLVFTEQFYFPDGWAGTQLPRDLTIHLARAGYAVEVICGSDPYAPLDGDPGEDPAAAGVRIRRIGRLIAGDIHDRKLLRQIGFYAGALPRLLFSRRPAAFVTQTNPPLVVVLAAFTAWLRRRPLVIIAMDLYPEVLFAHGSLAPRSLAGRLLAGLMGAAYRRAAAVVALGPTMARRIEAKGVGRARIAVISNWATGADNAVRGAANVLRREWHLEGCFVVLYSGNVGVAHDVRTPLLALRALRDRLPTLRLVFVGKGSRFGDVERVARALGVLDLVQVRPLVPLALLPHSLGLADLALVTLRPGFEGLVVPSKLLGTLARGVPTLYIGPPGDAWTLIEESGGGVAVANEDVDGVAALLERLATEPATLERFGRSGAEYYARHLARPIGLAKYVALLASVVARDRAPRGYGIEDRP
jgi:putative colanic acid biosynthesis glycosyltransferase WcaI